MNSFFDSAIKLSTATFLSIGLLTACGGGGSSKGANNIAPPDQPNNATVSTNFKFQVSSPDFAPAVAKANTLRNFINSIIPDALAAEENNLAANNFAVAIVDASGKVLQVVAPNSIERIALASGEFYYNIELPGGRRIDCVVAVDVNGTPTFTVGEAIPENYLITPTVDEGSVEEPVTIDIGSSLAYQQFLKNVDDFEAAKTTISVDELNNLVEAVQQQVKTIDTKKFTDLKSFTTASTSQIEQLVSTLTEIAKATVIAESSGNIVEDTKKLQKLIDDIAIFYKLAENDAVSTFETNANNASVLAQQTFGNLDSVSMAIDKLSTYISTLNLLDPNSTQQSFQVAPAFAGDVNATGFTGTFTFNDQTASGSLSGVYDGTNLQFELAADLSDGKTTGNFTITSAKINNADMFIAFDKGEVIMSGNADNRLAKSKNSAENTQFENGLQKASLSISGLNASLLKSSSGAVSFTGDLALEFIKANQRWIEKEGEEAQDWYNPNTAELNGRFTIGSEYLDMKLGFTASNADTFVPVTGLAENKAYTGLFSYNYVPSQEFELVGPVETMRIKPQGDSIVFENYNNTSKNITYTSVSSLGIPFDTYVNNTSNFDQFVYVDGLGGFQVKTSSLSSVAAGQSQPLTAVLYYSDPNTESNSNSFKGKFVLNSEIALDKIDKTSVELIMNKTGYNNFVNTINLSSGASSVTANIVVIADETISTMISNGEGTMLNGLQKLDAEESKPFTLNYGASSVTVEKVEAGVKFSFTDGSFKVL